MRKITLYTFVIHLCCSTGVFAQRTNNWYFPFRVGLSFSTDPPTELNNGQNAGAGAATISDINGNLLFYSDGIRVYNRNHAVMPNGTDLSGTSGAW